MLLLVLVLVVSLAFVVVVVVVFSAHFATGFKCKFCVDSDALNATCKLMK